MAALLEDSFYDVGTSTFLWTPLFKVRGTFFSQFNVVPLRATVKSN